MNSVASLAKDLVGGSRRALAKSLTLIESTRREHRLAAGELLHLVTQDNPRVGTSQRLGITGPPGAGKSTLIERMGLDLLEAGHQVAVLAIDPSSLRGAGGSILGDKTRMHKLAHDERAFVRPSATHGSRGGVARATGDAITLVEAAGFDRIVVETVGVGQGEAAAEALVDIFVLCETPTGGDSLQGIKRGIMELADILVVTKNDVYKEGAARTALEMRSALRLMAPKHAPEDAPGWETKVVRVSSMDGKNVGKLIGYIDELYNSMRESGGLDRRRAGQREAWLWSILADELVTRIRSQPAFQRVLPQVQEDLTQGSITPGTAVDRLLQEWQWN